jgi:hypothetical protein
MPLIRAMSREKIRKREKNPPKESAPSYGNKRKRGEEESWTPV